MASLKYTVDVDTKGAKSSIASLQRSIGGLGAALAGGFAVSELISFGDELISLQNRLRAFSSSQAEANSRFDQIAAIAGRTRSSLSDIGNLYTKMAMASQELGYSQEQVGAITETFAKSLKVGGANAASTASAILQFSQAMGSGVLRGEEFNAVNEASSSTIAELAKALGVPVGQMRKLAEEGRLTSKVVGDALLRMQSDVEEKFGKTTSTVGEAFTNIRTAAGIAFTELGTEPGAVKVLADIAGALINLTTDVKQLTVVMKELIQVLTLFGLTMVAVKAVAFLGPVLTAASAGVAKLGGAFAYIIAQGKVLSTVFGSLKSGAGGLGAKLASAFSLNAIKGGITTIVNLGKNIGMLIPIMFKTGNIFKGVRVIIGGVVGIFGRLLSFLPLILKGFLKFIPIAGWIWTIWEAIDALLKVFTGNGIIYYLNKAGTAIDDFFEKFLGVRIIDYVKAKISSLLTYLGGVLKFLNLSSGAAPAAAPAVVPPAAGGPPILPPATGGGRGGGRSPAEIARDQADALKDVRDAILEVTKAYRDSSRARLDDLQFQLRSLSMSEEQEELETKRRDILEEQASALGELADKEKEIRESTELSRRGREEALALIAQQVIAVNEQAAAELAATESTVQAIQAKNREIERSIRLTELDQQANENRATLQALEDQLKLVGLYGDALEDTTAQIELQQRLREIDVQYQNQLLDLEQRRARLGAERYADELANIEAVKAQAIASATAQAAAVKKVVDAQRRVDRNDVSVAIGRRLEELRRSVDPAVTAVETLDSVFSNMGNAIDSFVETGKFKFADFARSIIADIAKIALKAAATKILTSIFGGMFGVPGLAAGGPAMAGKPYLVGEQGPELFVPNSAGSIMTNASLNKNAGADSGMGATVNNTYITNNISAIDSRSVAQMFVENRKSLLGASVMARKEMPYGS